MNSAFVLLAIILARVVFPTPGGPQKIMEETRANVDWFVAVGEEADRLSRIKQSYHTAARNLCIPLSV